MDTKGWADIYTRSPRAAGPRVEGGHIRQTMSGHGITVMLNKNTWGVKKVQGQEKPVAKSSDIK